MNREAQFPFIPFNDGVVIRQDKPFDRTEGGLIIPEQAQEQLQTGTVIAVGPGGVLPDGSRNAMSATPGQKVFIKKFVGHKMNFYGVDYLVMSEEHILGGLTPEYVEELEAKVKKLRQQPEIPDIAEAARGFAE